MTSTDVAAQTARRNDLELVRRALGGSHDARTGLASRLQFIGRIVLVLNQRQPGLLSEHDLEDAVQDTVTAVLGKLETFNGECALETWVYAFCVHVLANTRRKKLLRTQRESVAPGGDLDGAEVVESDSERETIENSLARIGPPASDVIRERVFQERTFPEISARWNVAEATIKTWYYRGLKELGALLVKDQIG